MGRGSDVARPIHETYGPLEAWDRDASDSRQRKEKRSRVGAAAVATAPREPIVCERLEDF